MSDVERSTAIRRLVAESPGIRLGAALDACKGLGWPLADVSRNMVALIRGGGVTLTDDRRLYANE